MTGPLTTGLFTIGPVGPVKVGLLTIGPVGPVKVGPVGPIGPRYPGRAVCNGALLTTGGTSAVCNGTGGAVSDGVVVITAGASLGITGAVDGFMPSARPRRFGSLNAAPRITSPAKLPTVGSWPWRAFTPKLSPPPIPAPAATLIRALLIAARSRAVEAPSIDRSAVPIPERLGFTVAIIGATDPTHDETGFVSMSR